MKIIVALPSNVKQFMRDYRLPVVASILFIVVILFLFVGRLREHNALGQIIAVNKSGGGYANLLSQDKADDFVKRDVSADDAAAKDSANQQTSATSSATRQSTTITNPVTSGGGPTPNPIVAPQPFAATITDFLEDQSPSLQCPNGLLGNINLNKCNKVYSFAASVRTTNGPGNVNYGWEYSVSGSSTGNFVAASGTNIVTLHNQLTLSCKNPGSFNAKFVLTSPSTAQSATLQINHTCN